MPKPLNCISCKATIQVIDTAAGQYIKCPNCGQVVNAASGGSESGAASTEAPKMEEAATAMLSPPAAAAIGARPTPGVADQTLKTLNTAHSFPIDPPTRSPSAEEQPAESQATRHTLGAVNTNPAASAGPTLPGYEIVAELGRGGMGVVYKARQIKANRVVALKMILASRHASVQDRVRFQIETEAVARLQHPNIVQLYEVAEHDGLPFFSLEFCDGGSLDRRLKTWQPTAREAAELVEALARAMHYAHLRGVVHRDLKPANVLLAGDGTPKITDFGLAKQMDSGSDLSKSGAIMGTPSYMAPEQAEGKVHDTGPAADVYALGSLLYELLAGRPPFKAETAFETLKQVLTDEPTPPSRLRSGTPRDLETICLKCLRKQPGQRYASAGALADDLRRYQRGEVISARAVGRLERAVMWARRRPAVAALLLVTVLGMAGIVWKYLDADQQKRIAFAQTQEAQKEAATAKKARDFLVSIFRISETDFQGGNLTARQILADAERRIPVEFADQPELRADLVAAIEEVNHSIGLTIPAAMILEASGSIQIHSVRGVSREPVVQALLYPEDRLVLGSDAQLRLYFLADLHQEWLNPGKEAMLDRQGCESADAVAKRTQDILMTFARLPKGTFYMGWNGDKKGVKTEIKEDFEMAVHDVTQGQWQAVMGNNPSWCARKGQGIDAVRHVSEEELKLFPVEMVSWDEVQEFIKKLNEEEGGRGFLYRLPTEAEWEYACRLGASSEEDCSFHFYFARPTNDLSSEQANFNGENPCGNAPKGKWRLRTTRVGAYPPNRVGLCDMQGNVWQACADLWDPKASDSDRVARGGSWICFGSACQAAKRDRNKASDRFNDLGFRLVRVPAR